MGKTAVGVALAERLGAEVVALDSMTLYRGMDVGTAKPTPAERGGVPHHLLDVLDPWEAASVADYRRWAIRAVEEIEARGLRVLFVGGTALYLKALLRGLFEGPGADPVVREALEGEADRLGDPAMHDRLAALDPPTAARLHPNDRRRVIRALEVIGATGRPLSEQQVEHGRVAPGSTRVFALERPRAEMMGRIDRRVEAMFAEGLVEEIRSLLADPRGVGPVAGQGVGYREVGDLLAGRVERGEAVRRIQARTRQFAKRQATWFRGLAEVRPWPVGPEESAEAIAGRLLGAIGTGD